MQIDSYRLLRCRWLAVVLLAVVRLAVVLLAVVLLAVVLLAAFRRLASNITKASDHSGRE